MKIEKRVIMAVLTVNPNPIAVNKSDISTGLVPIMRARRPYMAIDNQITVVIAAIT